MHEEQLLRLIRLAQKTGDTLIVTDPSGHEPVVVMGVSRYEALLEDGLEADIHDLPEELFAPEFPPLEVEDKPMNFRDTPDPVLEPVKEVQEERNVATSETFEEEDPGEERFYLEPIE